MQNAWSVRYLYWKIDLTTIFTCVVTVLIYTHFVESECNFPSDLRGIWGHSFHGDLNFINSTQFLMTISTYENIAGNCHTAVDVNTFVIISERITIEFLGSQLTTSVGICLKMEKIKPNLYKLTHLTAELSVADFARIQIVLDPSNVVTSSVCSDQSEHAQKEYYLLMKTGSEDSVKIQCPESIQGQTNFNLLPSNCTGNMETCEIDSEIQICRSTCSGLAAYSDNGTVLCIYNTTDGGSDVLWTYNLDSSTDESSTFKFTCLLYEVNGTSFTGTQNPRFCDFTQTASDVSTGSTTASVARQAINGIISECDELTTTTTVTMTTTEPSISTTATIMTTTQPFVSTTATTMTTTQPSVSTTVTMTTTELSSSVSTPATMTTTELSSFASTKTSEITTSTEVTTTVSSTTQTLSQTDTTSKESSNSLSTTKESTTTISTMISTSTSQGLSSYTNTFSNETSGTSSTTEESPVTLSTLSTSSGPSETVISTFASSTGSGNINTDNTDALADELKNLIIISVVGGLLIIICVVTVILVCMFLRKRKKTSKQNLQYDNNAVYIEDNTKTVGKTTYDFSKRNTKYIPDNNFQYPYDIYPSIQWEPLKHSKRHNERRHGPKGETSKAVEKSLHSDQIKQHRKRHGERSVSSEKNKRHKNQHSERSVRSDQKQQHRTHRSERSVRSDQKKQHRNHHRAMPIYGGNLYDQYYQYYYPSY